MKLNKNVAAATLKALSLRFKVCQPLLEWDPAERRASIKLKTIRIGPKTNHGIDDVLHEFAHHLDYIENGNMNHGKTFQEILYSIATWWYGDPLKYSWDTEYVCVFNFIIRKIKS